MISKVYRIKIHNFYIIILSAYFLALLLPSKNVFALQPLAFGEIKAAGDVQIESSTGKWVAMHDDVYPLLEYTRLRTNNGIVSVTTTDGSRIDISRQTEVAIRAMNPGYTVDLLSCTGTISFNMSPMALLTVNTVQATVSTIGDAARRTQGMVTGNTNGTEIRSISGSVNAGLRNAEQRVLNEGERMFASGECVPAAGLKERAATFVSSKAGRALLTVTYMTGGSVIALEALREDDVASPSGFLVQ